VIQQLTRSLRPREWRNWSGTVRARPSRVVRARNLGEVVATVRAAARAGARLRPVGAGHSFTPLAATDGILLDLTRYSGILRADAETGLVTIRAGTRLGDLNDELAGLGLALPNLPDIEAQTVVGALATGTHGTGARLPGLAAGVRAIELVLADGTVVDCRADAPEAGERELFEAGRISLGALGVVSTVTLQCVPAFALHADEGPMPLDELLERLDTLADTEDHVEFFWFPHTATALVKRNNRLPPGAPATPRPRWRELAEDHLLENAGLSLMCRAARWVPPAVPLLNRASVAALGARDYSDRSDRVFSSPRAVRFVECEYAIPRESLRDVFAEVRALAEGAGVSTPLPVEVRFAAADDAWLSTAYERDTAYLAVHQYVGMRAGPWFRGFEALALAAGGRPHWGKLHSLGAAELSERYPRFEDFRRVVARVDPDGLFRNAYLDRILGPLEP
jgi:FAD-linked oxidoreductase